MELPDPNKWEEPFAIIYVGAETDASYDMLSTLKQGVFFDLYRVDDVSGIPGGPAPADTKAAVYNQRLSRTLFQANDLTARNVLGAIGGN
ncbi:MAG: hypothetical protein V3T86_09250 [Planctomycetota bacterium]